MNVQIGCVKMQLMQFGLLNFNFHPTVKFLLPEGEPDLEGLAIKREAEDYVLGTEFSHLNAEMKKMYLFYEGHPQLQQQKRESLWSQSYYRVFTLKNEMI